MKSKHMNENRRRIEEVIHEKKRTGERRSPCEAPLGIPNVADVAQLTITDI